MAERTFEDEIESLLRVSRTVSNNVPFEEALHAIIEETAKRLEFRTFAVVLLDEETEKLGIKIARGLSNAFIKRYRRPIGSGVTAKLIWEEQPVLMAAADKRSPDYKELRLENEFTTLLCVPIVMGEVASGYLHLDRSSGEAYTPDDLRFAQLMANLGATAWVTDRLRRLNEQLTFADELTQTLKYHAFLPALRRELERASMHGVRTAIGLLDLDNYKAHCEIHGLKAGRTVLAEVAGIVKSHVKGTDLVGRFGLDELVFAVFKVGSKQNARRLFSAIREAVEEYGRSCGEPHPLASIGGTLIEPGQEAEDFTRLVHLLRQALHHARDRGGNQVLFVEK